MTVIMIIVTLLFQMARRKGGGGATEKGNEREKQAGTEVDFFIQWWSWWSRWCWMVRGEGLNWEKWSRVFRDFWSSSLLKLRVTAVSLILAVHSVLPPSFCPFLLFSQPSGVDSKPTRSYLKQAPCVFLCKLWSHSVRVYVLRDNQMSLL